MAPWSGGIGRWLPWSSPLTSTGWDARSPRREGVDNRGGDRDHLLASVRQQGVRQRGVHEHDERREAIDTKDARQLRHGKDRDLAIAERHPREPAEEIATREFGRHPRGRHQEECARASTGHHARGDQGRHGRKQRQIRREEQRRQQRHRKRQAAKRADDGASPVDGADEIQGARRQTQHEGPQRRLAGQSLSRPSTRTLERLPGEYVRMPRQTSLSSRHYRPASRAWILRRRSA